MIARLGRPAALRRGREMDFYGFIKKYVWNEEKTPYLVPVGRLSQSQARNEIFVYSILMASFFLIAGVAALLGASIVAGSLVVAAYSFVVCGAAVILSATLREWPAFICATAPPASSSPGKSPAPWSM